LDAGRIANGGSQREAASLTARSRDTLPSVPCTPGRSRHGFLFGCLFVALLKLILVAGDDMQGWRPDSDERGYLVAADAWYWGQPADQQPLIRRPAFPLWMSLLSTTIVPLRFANELLYLLCAFAFAYSVRRIGIVRGLPQHKWCDAAGLASFVLIAFQPFSLVLLRLALCDGFYGCLFLLMAAAFVLLLCRRPTDRGFRAASLAGLAGGLLWLTREESPLIVLAVASSLDVVVWRHRERGFGWRATVSQMIGPSLGTFVIVAAIVSAAETATWVRYGVFAPSAFTTPHYTRAYSALLQIRPPARTAYVSISHGARELAYEVSPAFARLRSFLEGPPSQTWRDYSRAVGVTDDFATGWFPWAFESALQSSGCSKNMTLREDCLRDIADELELGLADGRLPRRSAMFGPIAPDLLSYLPHVVDAVRRVLQPFIAIDPGIHASAGRENESAEVAELFDRITNRRSWATEMESITISGWAYHPKDPLSFVVLRHRDGRIWSTSGQLQTRPDLEIAGIHEDDAAPPDVGFFLTAMVPAMSIQDAQIELVTRSAQRSAVSLADATPAVVRTIQTSGSDVPVLFCVDAITIRKHDVRWKKVIGRWIWALNRPVTIGMIAAAAMVGLLVYVSRKRRPFERRDPILLMSAVLLGSLVLARVSLFTIVDLTSWPAARPRFLFPAMTVLAGFLPAVIIYGVSDLISCNRGR